MRRRQRGKEGNVKDGDEREDEEKKKGKKSWRPQKKREPQT